MLTYTVPIKGIGFGNLAKDISKYYSFCPLPGIHQLVDGFTAITSQALLHIFQSIIITYSMHKNHQMVLCVVQNKPWRVYFWKIFLPLQGMVIQIHVPITNMFCGFPWNFGFVGVLSDDIHIICFAMCSLTPPPSEATPGHCWINYHNITNQNFHLVPWMHADFLPNKFLSLFFWQCGTASVHWLFIQHYVYFFSIWHLKVLADFLPNYFFIHYYSCGTTHELLTCKLILL